MICNFVKWARFFYDSNEVLFFFFNMVSSKKTKILLNRREIDDGMLEIINDFRLETDVFCLDVYIVE